MKALYQKCGKVGAGRDAVTLCMIRNFSAAVSIRDPDRKAPISTRASMRQTKTKTEMKIETQNFPSAMTRETHYSSSFASATSSSKFWLLYMNCMYVIITIWKTNERYNSTVFRNEIESRNEIPS